MSKINYLLDDWLKDSQELCDAYEFRLRRMMRRESRIAWYRNGYSQIGKLVLDPMVRRNLLDTKLTVKNESTGKTVTVRLADVEDILEY